MIYLFSDRDWALWEDDSDSDHSVTELKAGPPLDINRDEVFTQTQEPGSSKRKNTAEHRKV